MSISGEELFGKDSSGNLNRSALKKAKKKKNDLDKIIGSNLPILTEWYFTSYQKGDERRKWEGHLLKLLGSDVYFIQPLKRLLKKSKKKKAKFEIPDGLCAILMDNMDEIRILYHKQTKQLGSNTTWSKEIEDRINTIKTLTDILMKNTSEICETLSEKRANKLTKMGMSEEYAKILACAYIPTKYLTTRNVRRYINRLNTTLYDIQNQGVKIRNDTDEDGNAYRNGVGLNLGDPDVIKELYEFFFKKMKRKIYIQALVGIMLERKGALYDSFTKPQLACYNAITRLILNVLEGDEIINIEGGKIPKGKEGKSLKKELQIGKKELKNFMSIYSDEKAQDASKGRDSARRISFSNVKADDYPKVAKAFKQCMKDYFDDMFDENDEKKPDKPKQQNTNDNKNKSNNNQQRKDNKNNH